MEKISSRWEKVRRLFIFDFKIRKFYLVVGGIIVKNCMIGVI